MTTKSKNIAVVTAIALLVAGLSVWCWLKQPQSFSDAERRVLASFPEVSRESVLSGEFMQDFETYALDQFPFRDSFRTVKAVFELGVLGKRDNNGIYVENGYVSKLEYPLNEAMLEYAAERFRHVYESYLKNKEHAIYFSIVPDKNYFMAESSGHLSLDYEKLISIMREKTEYMEYVDITGVLSLEDYYRTDTHWKQEKLKDAAAVLAQAMDISLSKQCEEKILAQPFYGVYCGQSALPLQPDTITYLTNETLEQCIVTSYSTGIAKKSAMYNMEKAAGKDAYEIFLSGTEALMTIENKNAATQKELIVFRDSFGSSLIPLLTEGYKKITVVDLRYISSDLLGQYITFNNQDVLFLYSTLLLNNSMAIKK